MLNFGFRKLRVMTIRRAFALYALAALCAAWRVLAAPGATLEKVATPQKVAANSSEGFRLALPGYKYTFPRDHASHPEYQTEWWYYTGHLQSTHGENFGYQLTFFRTALTPKLLDRKSKWAVRDIMFAHLALTDETNEKFYFDDRIARANLGLAGAEPGTSTPRIWLDDWDVQFNGNEQVQNLKAASQSGAPSTPFSIELSQRVLKSPVIHGQNGVSQKSAGRGRASHYYSFPRLQTTGTIKLSGKEYSVRGESWFDHEFGSNQLSSEQAGWDWFSIQLDDGRELMLYQLRLENGTVDPYSSGTIVEKGGRARHLKLADFSVDVLEWWQSPRSHAKYPARWKVNLPRENLALEIEPAVADQELDTKRSTGLTYWEGSVRVLGANRELIGRGYVELTGYAQQLNATF
jgi:predicted secreted hydrolase